MDSPEPDDPAILQDLERLARASVLVLGDAALERRVFGAGSDGEVEPALRLTGEAATPGAGAGIVASLAAIGVATAFVCVLGDDLAGAELTALIGAQANVEPWLLVDGAMSTTTETTYLDGDDIVFRTIREARHAMHPRMRERMLRIAADAMAATSLSLLSDRDHGTLDGESVATFLAAARQANRPVIAEIGATLLPGAAGPVLDRHRGADALVALRRDPADDLEAAARALREAAETATAMIVVPGVASVLADGHGTARIALAGHREPPAAYLDLVAAFASAMALGRAPRHALAVAVAATRRAAPPGTTP